jgi:hypothetical protein
MVIGSEGYEPVLEVILDTVTLTSSVNDYQLLSAESCSVHSESLEDGLVANAFLSGSKHNARSSPVER